MSNLLRRWEGRSDALGIVGGIAVVATGGALAYAIAAEGLVLASGGTLIVVRRRCCAGGAEETVSPRSDHQLLEHRHPPLVTAGARPSGRFERGDFQKKHDVLSDN